jgi:ketosteroid isomerase-like protein
VTGPTFPDGHDVELARRLELEVWGGGRLDVLDQIAAETYTVHDVGLGRTFAGRDAVREDMARFRSELAISEVVMNQVIASPGWVVVRWTVHATHVGVPPTGRAVKARGVDVLRIEHGRLAEAWVISNDADIEAQIRGPVVGERELAAWIDAYARAWREGDAEAAAALFTETATYRSAPFRPPHVGREEIVRYWREEPARHEGVELAFGTPVVEGRRVAVEWWATVVQNGETVTGPGCLVLRFDRDGRCEELREYWHEQPGRHEPPLGWGS